MSIDDEKIEDQRGFPLESMKESLCSITKLIRRFKSSLFWGLSVGFDALKWRMRLASPFR